MGLVIEALISMGFVVGAAWAVSLWRSAARDRAVAAEARSKSEREAAMDSALAAPGRRLHCVNCDHRFAGPMPDDGCPKCHLSTLVVPDDNEQPENRIMINPTTE